MIILSRLSALKQTQINESTRFVPCMCTINLFLYEMMHCTYLAWGEKHCSHTSSYSNIGQDIESFAIDGKKTTRHKESTHISNKQPQICPSVPLSMSAPTCKSACLKKYKSKVKDGNLEYTKCFCAWPKNCMLPVPRPPITPFATDVVSML